MDRLAKGGNLHSGWICSKRMEIFRSGWKFFSLQGGNISPSRVDNVLRGWKSSIQDGNFSSSRMEIFLQGGNLPPGWKSFSLQDGQCSARVEIFHQDGSFREHTSKKVMYTRINTELMWKVGAKNWNYPPCDWAPQSQWATEGGLKLIMCWNKNSK